jgi:hypothetical protein
MALADEINLRENEARKKVESKMAKVKALADDSKAFGVNEETRPPHLMITFRLLDGTAMSFPYGYLINIFFDDDGRVILSFTSHTVTVEGENLEALFKRLEIWSVGFVQELEPADKKDKQPFVSAIIIEQRREGVDE